MAAELILHPLETEMPMIPLGGRNAVIFLHKFRIHIVGVGTCQNVGSGVVRCVTRSLITFVICDFFVTVCSHRFENL